ncbi:hypothetical protein HMPREF1015_02565, partial [Bacillus smithii 7_3_47FAA]
MANKAYKFTSVTNTRTRATLTKPYGLRSFRL